MSEPDIRPQRRWPAVKPERAKADDGALTMTEAQRRDAENLARLQAARPLSPPKRKAK